MIPRANPRPLWRPSARLRWFAVPACFLAFSMSFGCDDDGPIQPNDPNANDAVVNRVVFGDPENRTLVYNLAVNSAGIGVFDGLVNGEGKAGRTTDASRLDDTWSPGFSIGEVRSFPSTGPTGDAFLLCGYTKSDADPSQLVGVVRVLAPDGSVIADGRIEIAGYGVWLWSIRLVSSEVTVDRFVVGGGARAGGTYWPFTALVSIQQDGSVTVERYAVYQQFPRREIWWITGNDDLLDPHYFATVARYSTDSDFLSSAVFSFGDTLQFEWVKGITIPDAYWATYRELCYWDSSIYVVGESMMEKGDHFGTVGVVVKLDTAGLIQWKQVVSLSQFSDSYRACDVQNGVLYAAGEYSKVTQESTNHRFGYGLASTFDLPSGSATSHSTVGGKDYRSNFSSVRAVGSRVFCGGLTKYYIDGYWYQGWIAEIDVAVGGAMPLPTVDVIAAKNEVSFVADAGQVWIQPPFGGRSRR